jgi:crotonobetaine/carnitine-CoA ligase
MTRTAERLRFPTREEAVLPELLARRAASTPEKPFVLFGEEQWSYRQAALEAWRSGNALAVLGVGLGDSVSVWLPTGPDVLRAWFGANALGAVYAPLNVAARGRYLEHTMNLAESKVLVAHAALVERLAGLELPHLETVVVAGDATDVDLPWRTLQLEDLLAGVSTERPALERPVEPWDDLSLIYTSGTTGPSKGVRAAHAAFWTYARCFIEPFVTADDVYLQPLPMFYTAGTGITYSMLFAGGAVAYLKGFDPKTFWDDVRRFDATITIVIHGMVSYLLDQPPGDDDAGSSLRTVYMGPLSRVREFSERFGASIYTAYGMTEVPVPIVSELNPDDERSCGRAADPEHYELRLVDEHDVEVPVGTPGELIARHALPWTINSGYKNMPEATAEAWRNGWFHTGDQFVQDEEGRFYFLDRMKDVIRRRGVNISSFEVEAEVLAHPLVREVAAVAVPNPDLDDAAGDEEVKVVVVLEEGATLDPAELVEFVAGRAPRHWVPRFVEFAPALPRTESYKVKKAELRSAGVTGTTWDRERAGIRYKREALA